MKVTRFDPTRDLLIVDARIWSPRSDTKLTLAIDTGSSETVVAPEIIDDLGYSARDGEKITTVRSAVSEERGYTVLVKRFSALGFVVPDIASMFSTSPPALAAWERMFRTSSKLASGASRRRTR